MDETTTVYAGGRQIGPIGTLARIAVGAAAVAVPVALEGFSWWEATVALVALPLISVVAAPLVTALFRRFAPGLFEARHALCSAPACSLIALMVAANDALVAPTTANGNVTISVWLGASMLLAAARGYGGCEVLAAWNLLTRRSDQIGCFFYTPIDRAESRERDCTTRS
jgi:hypothetical protein